MLKRILKKTAIFIVVLAITSTILYLFFGLRILVRGDGSMSLGFVRSADAQADDLEQHRAAQRATSPPQPVTAPSLPAAVISDATNPVNSVAATRAAVP